MNVTDQNQSPVIYELGNYFMSMTNCVSGFIGKPPVINCCQKNKYSWNMVFRPVGNSFLLYPSLISIYVFNYNGILLICYKIRALTDYHVTCCDKKL